MDLAEESLKGLCLLAFSSTFCSKQGSLKLCHIVQGLALSTWSISKYRDPTTSLLAVAEQHHCWEKESFPYVQPEFSLL